MHTLVLPTLHPLPLPHAAQYNMSFYCAYLAKWPGLCIAQASAATGALTSYSALPHPTRRVIY